MFLATSTLHPSMAAFGGLGAPEVIIIVLVVLLLFGGRKLPEVARGTGRALRIFKAETKGLMDDEDDVDGNDRRTTAPQQQITRSQTTAAEPPAAPAEPVRPASDDQLPPTHTEK